MCPSVRVAALPQPLSIEIEPAGQIRRRRRGRIGGGDLSHGCSAAAAEGFLHLGDWRVRLVDGVPRMLNATLMENLGGACGTRHP